MPLPSGSLLLAALLALVLAAARRSVDVVRAWSSSAAATAMAPESSSSPSSFSQSLPAHDDLVRRRILLLTAHPDDEAMFFAPTLLALTTPARANDVRLLCLSTGDADGLGALRQREVHVAAGMLGIGGGEEGEVGDDDGGEAGGGDYCHRPGPSDSSGITTSITTTSNSSSHSRCHPRQQQEQQHQQQQQKPAAVTVLDDARFPDSMTAAWSPAAIAGVLRDAHTAAPFNTILTFDAGGVSSHPNHRALHAGARLYAETAAAEAAEAAEAATGDGTSADTKDGPVEEGRGSSGLAAAAAGDCASPTARTGTATTTATPADGRGPARGHQTHQTRPAAAATLTSRTRPSALTSVSTPRLYTLTTTGLLRKYTGSLDALLSYVLVARAGRGGGRGGAGADADVAGGAATAAAANHSRLLFVNDAAGYQAARAAMVRGHRSQMVWFRWGWVTIGRYMVVNDVRREW